MSEEQQLSQEELQALMTARAARARQEACQAEIDAALQKHRCRLVGVPAVAQDGRIVARVQVVVVE